MNDVKMFVIAHKECKIPKVKGYHSLLVGANNTCIDGFEYKDDVGKNISYKNSSYCELTGIYWIRHNVLCDVVGISHYRRFFTKSFFSNDVKFFLNADDISRILERYDVILPSKLYYRGKIRDIVKHAPNKKDLAEITDAITAICPEYIDSYNEFLNQNSAYLLNMFVMRKKFFDKYCDWLFPILEYIEERHDLSKEDNYRKRLFGFLSERLIYVWVKQNIDESKIKELRVVNTDIGIVVTLSKEIKNLLKKIFVKW